MKSISAVLLALSVTGAYAGDAPLINDCFNAGEPAVTLAEQPDALQVTDSDIAALLADIAVHETTAVAAHNDYETPVPAMSPIPARWSRPSQ